MDRRVRYLEWLEVVFGAVLVGLWGLGLEKGLRRVKGSDIVMGLEMEKDLDLEMGLATGRLTAMGRPKERSPLVEKDPVKMTDLEVAMGRPRERDPLRVKGLAK